jgi:hypothetical protein
MTVIAGVVAHPQLSRLLHHYYTTGKQIYDAAAINGFSNAQVQTLATQIVTDRGSAICNTVHLAVLNNLANSTFA